MQRVKRTTAVAVLPAAPAGGTPGYFAAPNPQGGVPATVPGYEWYNHVQEEIVALIAAAGLPLDGANNAQMLEAVQRLIDAQSGNYALDTGVANAYVVALNPAIATYTDGMTVRVKIVNANTAASTLNAGGGVVPLVNDVGGALVAGDLPTSGIVTATYIASAAKFYITSLVQSQGDARYAINTPGGVSFFAGGTAPTGYLKANGSAISRSTYAALFSAIGTVFGAGDGSTTFNVPDLRGEFIRGFDDGRGVDTGRAFGSAQLDALQGHKHASTTDGAKAYAAGAVTGDYPSASGAGTAATAVGLPTTDGTHGAPRTGAETRPRNVALLACIKY